MNITEYRKELESKGYKTKRIKREHDVEYYAYKDGKYYWFAICGIMNEKSLVEVDLNTMKEEYAEPIRKAFERRRKPLDLCDLMCGG